MDFNDFLDEGTDKEFYEKINRNILEGNVMKIYLIIRVGKYGAIDTDDPSCNGYYIIKFYSLPYTLKSDLSIDGQVI